MQMVGVVPGSPKEEHRSVMQFMVSKGKSTGEIYRRTFALYGEVRPVSHVALCIGVGTFERARKVLMTCPLLGQGHIAFADDNCEGE